MKDILGDYETFVRSLSRGLSEHGIQRDELSMMDHICYRVETEEVIEPHYVETFAQGIYFAFEDLTTLPAHLDILGPRMARLSIVEGRYHQVKRMFGHFQNKVVKLHRERMGELVLDESLQPGQYRSLSAEEIGLV